MAFWPVCIQPSHDIAKLLLHIIENQFVVLVGFLHATRLLRRLLFNRSQAELLAEFVQDVMAQHLFLLLVSEK